MCRVATVLSSTGVERGGIGRRVPTQFLPNSSALGFAKILVAGLRLKIGMELRFWEEGQS